MEIEDFEMDDLANNFEGLGVTPKINTGLAAQNPNNCYMCSIWYIKTNGEKGSLNNFLFRKGKDWIMLNDWGVSLEEIAEWWSKMIKRPPRTEHVKPLDSPVWNDAYVRPIWTAISNNGYSPDKYGWAFIRSNDTKHMIVVEKTSSGNWQFYDPQSNERNCLLEEYKEGWLFC